MPVQAGSQAGGQRACSDRVRSGCSPLPPGDAVSAAAVSDFWLSSDMRGALWVRCAGRPSLPAMRSGFMSHGDDCSLTLPVLDLWQPDASPRDVLCTGDDQVQKSKTCVHAADSSEGWPYLMSRGCTARFFMDRTMRLDEIVVLGIAVLIAVDLHGVLHRADGLRRPPVRRCLPRTPRCTWA